MRLRVLCTAIFSSFLILDFWAKENGQIAAGCCGLIGKFWRDNSMNQADEPIEHIAECDTAEFNDELTDEALDRCDAASATICTVPSSRGPA